MGACNAKDPCKLQSERREKKDSVCVDVRARGAHVCEAYTFSVINSCGKTSPRVCYKTPTDPYRPNFAWPV